MFLVFVLRQGSHYVVLAVLNSLGVIQTGLELRDSLASASQVVGLKVFNNITCHILAFFFFEAVFYYVVLELTI